MTGLTIDLVAFDRAGEACHLVLMEGPWSGAFETNMRALQTRLYDCLDVVLSGQLANDFPDSIGKTIVIQIKGRDLPRREVELFVDKFAAVIGAMPHYDAAASPYVGAFRFEVSHDAPGG